MRFDVVTLFPELFAPFLSSGVTRRAFESGQVELRLWNPRDWAEGNYKRVDDRAFGGGPGMVMMAEPLARCLDAIAADRRDVAPVVLFAPVGEPLRHAAVAQWSASAGAVLLCGRYEGIDQRLVDRYVTHCISLGDFVLSGGEIAALALLDAVARLQPGVLNDQDSHQFDSFHPALDGLLDCPHYTRPEDWRGAAVPEVLLSGHHGRIARWRRDAQLRLTAAQRPDLLAAARAAGRLTKQDEAVLAQAPTAGL
ncbi:tRNA (guanosine(37)-N1)-methyltransferase TrmD [Pseudorhodoferax sp. Leaf267]|uniref:tRNA (guanosine(37)-N1)-methyltransferase TrmD n=1 Tax=Pseudorhodoferax sp. Leaf267 TaxID=1736316 RepID=UPI0006FE6E93|nr:tRNA (guanosine(37)-N1)-methyltransferase TrmD [Pseudorhodoferax sp. Leaf267]KQP17942.1 tRNA (guanine-N1)-methyltransferase [Pseudorhodoferax sp. Leaf267]